MRTFITLEFDRATKEKIVGVQKLIKDCSISGRFKYIDNFHLTLKFLGETDIKKVDSIYNDLSYNLKGFKKFKAGFNGIGAFGLGECIKTIYIKTVSFRDVLEQLAKIVDETTIKYGFKMEQRYTPHVTIAQDVELKIPFSSLQDKAVNIFNHEVSFDRVIIMKSEQVGNKRVYTPIKSIMLCE